MIFNYKKAKDKLFNIIFGTDTLAGKAFDILLITTILCNSILVIIESVDSIRDTYGAWIRSMEWFFVGIFTIEYIVRLIIVKRRYKYIYSFFGIIDLLSILPLYLSFIFPQLRFFAVVRIFRLLRLFSVLKMGRYIDQSNHLIRALRSSRPKIIIFLTTILFIIVMVGTMMYIIEGSENGFVNIPESMYWAIVTVSTVGYGDISPQTPFGKLLSSFLMIVAYGILAVPTGIIYNELAQTTKVKGKTKKCLVCDTQAYNEYDKFCSNCGTKYNST